MSWRVLVAAVCLLSGVTGIAQVKPKDDLQLLQGTWAWHPAARQSDARPQVLLERLVIKGDTLTGRYRANNGYFGDFVLKSSAKK